MPTQEQQHAFDELEHSDGREAGLVVML